MTSTPGPSLCSQKVKAFLVEYKKDETQNLFKDLAEATRKKCEELLQSKKIKGVVQSRSKGYDSLETKLNDMTKTGEFDEKKMETGGVYEHQEMGDLAGVRVGLFFPGDVLEVAQEINKFFKVLYTFGTVSDTARSAVNGRNHEIQRHGDGRWAEQGSSKDVEHWEHYGYKSWQVVVEWNEPLPEVIKSISAALAPTKLFNPLRIEIQVGTVVTQAWAEVQHNIIYKKSIAIQATPTMKRMIDAINGLAITTDIMLIELKRSLAQAEKEAERQARWEKDRPLEMLRYACQGGDHEAVIRLLKGFNVNAHLFEGGSRAIHLASENGHSNVVEELLKDNRVEVNAKEDGLGRTALHLASTEGYSNVVARLLKDNRVEVNAEEDGFGMTALHLASKEGHSNVVEELLKDNRVEVNAKEDGLGRTALHLASTEGHSNVVEELLKDNRVEVNARDTSQNTALHLASRYGHSNVVEELLLKGANVSAKDKMGITPLDWASCNKGYSNVVKQLKAALNYREK